MSDHSGYGTQHELNFIEGIGTYTERSTAEARASGRRGLERMERLLEGYVLSALTRSRWENVDGDVALRAARARLGMVRKQLGRAVV